MPEVLTEYEKQRVLKKIKPFEGQEVYFSYIQYDKLLPAEHGSDRLLSSLNEHSELIVLTGIAFPKPLIDELNKYTPRIIHQQYPDHHPFTRKNIIKLAQAFESLKGADKLIVTTEKDMQRLRGAEGYELLSALPVYYLPVSVKIHDDEAGFCRLIQTYVTKHLLNNSVY